MHPRFAKPKTYHAGAVVWRFGAWAVGMSFLAYLAVAEVIEWGPRHPSPKTMLGLALAAVLLGPLAFFVQLVRRACVRITVDPAAGLTLSNGELIPWDQVTTYDHRAGIMDDLDRLATPEDPFARRSLFRMEGPIWSVRAWVLLFAFLTFYYTLYPVVLVLSPLHPRVRIFLRDGRRLTYRNLQDDAEFAYRIQQGMRRHRA